VFCPICEQSAARFESYGLVPRDNARCPCCRSLERHRLVWLFFCRHTDLFSPRPKRFLHLAPEYGLSQRLRASASLFYLSADLDPRRAMIQMDITNTKLPTNSFDAIYCSHVLEHVADDQAAMRELWRVLSPSGWAAFMVPITAPVTFEDWRVTRPEDRERVFGQPDHVRCYGPDFGKRLERAGYKVRRIDARDVATDLEMRALALNRSDVIFFATK